MSVSIVKMNWLKLGNVMAEMPWLEFPICWKRTLEYIRDQLPALDGKEYMKNPPKEFLRFIEDWAKQ